MTRVYPTSPPGDSGSTPRGAPTIHVVEDDEGVRSALLWLFEGEGFIARGYSTCEAFLADSAITGPAALVLDLRVPGMGGVAFIERHAQEVGLPIIVVTAHADVATAVRCVRLGVVEVLTKPFEPQRLVTAVRETLQRREGPSIDTHRAELRRRLGVLTVREREVMALMIEARSNREIGTALTISPKTVDVHRSNVLRKLGLDSTSDLIRTLTRYQLA